MTAPLKLKIVLHDPLSPSIYLSKENRIINSKKYSHFSVRCSIIYSLLVMEAVQFSHTVVSDSLQPHELHAARQASLSITNSWSLPKPMSIQLVMPSNHLILCHSLLLLPSIFPSIRVFSNESALHMRWPKYWSFSFNISPSSDHPGLISFRMDWLDLLAVQGTLKSLQHQHSKASILLCSAFLIVQLSHPYMKQCRCPSMVEQIKKIWYSHTGTLFIH